MSKELIRKVIFINFKGQLITAYARLYFVEKDFEVSINTIGEADLTDNNKRELKEMITEKVLEEYTIKCC